MAFASPRGARAAVDRCTHIASAALPRTLPPLHVRPRLLAAAMVLALVSMLGVVAGTGSAESGTAPPTGPVPPGPVPPSGSPPSSAAPLYRLVGCHSHGGAFDHGA